MNHQLELKVQAYLDGELSPSESRQIEAVLAQDAEAKSVLEELRYAKELVATNELARSLPAPAEFFWSQVQRRILAEEQALKPKTTFWHRLALRYLAPAAGAAFLLVFILSLLNPEQSMEGMALDGELESVLAQGSVIAFRSESADMTVVWIETHSR